MATVENLGPHRFTREGWGGQFSLLSSLDHYFKLKNKALGFFGNTRQSY